MVIKSIGVWSAAKLYAAICAAMGLLLGLVFAAISMVGSGLAASDPDAPAWMAGAFGVGAVVILPIFYGILGLFGGAIGAVLYNLFAGMVGGVEIETS